MNFANAIKPKMNRHSTTNSTMLFVGVGGLSGNLAVGSIGNKPIAWNEDGDQRRSYSRRTRQDALRRILLSCPTYFARNDAKDCASRIEFARRVTTSCALGQAGWPPHPPTTPGRPALRSLSEATSYDQPRYQSFVSQGFAAASNGSATSPILVISRSGPTPHSSIARGAWRSTLANPAPLA